MLETMGVYRAECSRCSHTVFRTTRSRQEAKRDLESAGWRIEENSAGNLCPPCLERRRVASLERIQKGEKQREFKTPLLRCDHCHTIVYASTAVIGDRCEFCWHGNLFPLPTRS